MDFDALLDDDEAFGGVDFDQLESHARSKQPPPLPRPAGSGTSSGHNLGARPMTSHPVPKPYRQQQQAPVASSSRTTYNSPTQGPVLSQTGLWGSQPIQVRQAAALQVSQPKAKDTTVAVKICKRWDRGVWAELGWGKRSKQQKNKKGKKRARDDNEEDLLDEDDLDADEDDDDPVLARINQDHQADPELTAPKAPPMRLSVDHEAASHWVYPIVEGKSIRDYQYNIAHKALFNNVLCSLPTGLGKTFIAAVVIMNFYRCFPQGKILFMAPTKPLVAQQIEACHSIGGIPNEHSCEMTGQDAGTARASAWRDRRVFYCTPQTVASDLKQGRLDASQVVLVVVDEAHKASGDYAYSTVVRFLMAKNPHFRILALTATPGSKSEAVQAVIDNLHIGHIEVRTEQSMDIQPHIHQKEQDIRIISLSPDILHLRDMVYKLIEEPLNRLKSRSYIQCHSLDKLSPYLVLMAKQRMGADRELSAGAKAAYWGAANQLDPLVRALENLLTKSVKSFFLKLRDIKEGSWGEDDESGASAAKRKRSGSGGTKKSPKLASSEGFVSLYRQAQQVMSAPGGEGHPKMAVLLEALKEHFNAAELKGEETRVMVFSTHRDLVEELVEIINQERPMLKAARFVGQGSDSKGRKGSNQKEQLSTINAFKRGDHNILVATSIGEEGLDIGEVDVIFCYDAPKSPIRMLQRVGRTGRARQGKIVVLMAEGKEEGNWQRATDSYNDVQNALVQGRTLSLYEDCDQLFPNRKMPCEKITMAVEKYEKQSIRANSRKSSTKEKKQSSRSAQPPPADLPMMFQKGSEVLASRKKRKSSTGAGTPAQDARASALPPVLNEAEEMNERRDAALPSLEQLDQLSAFPWSESVSAARVTRHRVKSDQLLQPVPSRLSARSARLTSMFKQATLREHSPTAYEAWETEVWSRGFDQSEVHWWDEADYGTSTRPHNACRLTQQPTRPINLDAAKRARAQVDAFGLNMATQFRQHLEEAADEDEESQSEDAAAAAAAADTANIFSDGEMDDFIVPDDAPVERSSKSNKKKSQRSQKPRPQASPSYSDDDFDSALAQDTFVPDPLPINPPARTVTRGTGGKKARKIVLASSDSNDSEDALPDLPDLDDPSLIRKAGQRPPAPPRKQPSLISPARRKPGQQAVVDLVSDDPDDLPPPVPLNRAADAAPSGTVSPQRAAPPEIVVHSSPEAKSKTFERPGLPQPSPSGVPTFASHSDTLDSSDEEMMSMPKLPSPKPRKSAADDSSTERQDVHPDVELNPPIEPSSPPVPVRSEDEADDDDHLFGSFVMDNNMLDALDAAAGEAGLLHRSARQPSPATLAMPPPPTISRKRPAELDTTACEASRSSKDHTLGGDSSSSAVKPPGGGKPKKVPGAGRVRSRVILSSSSPARETSSPMRHHRSSSIDSGFPMADTDRKEAAGRRLKPLRELDPLKESTAGAGASSSKRKAPLAALAQEGGERKRRKEKRKKTKNPFIAASQAVCSDGSNNATSDENLPDAPDSSDREALTDGEVEANESMMRFYKDSMQTQAPRNQEGQVQFGERRFGGAAYKMNFGRGDPYFVATQRMSDEPVSDYLDESFCVEDDVVEYQSDQGDGLPSDL